MKYSTMIHCAAAWLEVPPQGKCGTRLHACAARAGAVDIHPAREAGLVSQRMDT